MLHKITRADIAQKKAQAQLDNWEMPNKGGLIRSYIQPNNPRTSRMDWLGIKPLHKRGVAVLELQKKWAMS